MTTALLLAASLTFQWNAQPEATGFVLYLNNQVAWVGSTNTCTVPVEPSVTYRAELSAVNVGGESDRVGLTVSVSPVTLYWERAGSVTGPWQVVQTNTGYFLNSTSAFYRARVGVP